MPYINNCCFIIETRINPWRRVVVTMFRLPSVHGLLLLSIRGNISSKFSGIFESSVGSYDTTCVTFLNF